MIQRPPPSRRGLLKQATRLGTVAMAWPLMTASVRAAAGANERRLSLVHTHTRERVDLAYAVEDRYVPQALGLLDHFLRDHYSGQVGRIDPRLYDLLHQLQHEFAATAADASFEIVSAYRCAATNARLRETRGGGVARHSLHLEGRALDVRLQGVPLADLRDAACASRAGGVGFYARERFVHLDTGRVRTW